MTKKEYALLCILYHFEKEMRAGAGWRENDVLNRLEDFEPEKDSNGNFIFTFYTAPDADGRRDSAQYHTGRHAWTN